MRKLYVETDVFSSRWSRAEHHRHTQQFYEDVFNYFKQILSYV